MVSRIDEADLLARLRSGDESAFHNLVIELSGGMLRMAASYGLTPTAAEDAVQETWIVVITRLSSFEGRSALSTWIYSILINTARRSGSRERRAIPFSSAWRDEQAPAVAAERFHNSRSEGAAGTWSSTVDRWDQQPTARLESAEVRAVIDAAIDALPARQREVIISRDIMDMDTEEACIALGLSAGNLRVLLHRARSRVRQALETYFAEEVVL